MKRHFFFTDKNSVIIGCTVVLFAVGFYCVLPEINSYLNLVDQVDSLEKKAEKQQDLSRAYSRIIKENSLIEEGLPDISTFSALGVPSVSNMKIMRSTIEEHDVRCDIEIPSITSSRHAKKALLYTVIFEGSFINCTKAMKDLVLLPMVLSADSFSFTSRKGDSSTIFNVQLSVVFIEE